MKMRGKAAGFARNPSSASSISSVCALESDPPGGSGLSMPAGGLLEVRDPAGRLRFVAERGEFGCDQGTLRVWYSDGGAGDVGVAWGWVTVDLTKDADGWLVVRIDEKSLALLGYVIPAHISGTRWYRFRPTAP